METVLIILVGIILIAGLIALSRKKRWTMLASGRGDQGNDLEAKNSYLQSHNIRSRIKAQTAGPASGFAASGVGYTADDTKNMIYRLEVKPQDREQAEALLSTFERERLLHNDLIL
jgi:hypothetical protein